MESTELTPVARTGLEPQRLRRIKKSYTTRYVAAELDRHPEGYCLHSGPALSPRPGDLVVARVVEIGRHTRLEGPASRRQMLFPGQEVLLAYGPRYAPDQFLAHVPADLGTCHLVAAGGVAGTVVTQHASSDDPTVIEPLGLLADAAGVINLDRCAPHSPRGAPIAAPRHRPLVVAVLGTSMNSGKSTTLACLVNGLTNAGLVVGTGKVTGTGAGGDLNLFRDAGAVRVLDFTDFGHPSTYLLDQQEVVALWTRMVDTLSADAPDVVVLEIADGLYQRETRMLLAEPAFGSRVDHVVFAAQDALGASAGLAELGRHGVHALLVSGVLTASPLATGEARSVLDVPVVDTYDLCRPAVLGSLLPGTVPVR